MRPKPPDISRMCSPRSASTSVGSSEAAPGEVGREQVASPQRRRRRGHLSARPVLLRAPAAAAASGVRSVHSRKRRQPRALSGRLPRGTDTEPPPAGWSSPSRRAGHGILSRPFSDLSIPAASSAPSGLQTPHTHARAEFAPSSTSACAVPRLCGCSASHELRRQQKRYRPFVHWQKNGMHALCCEQHWLLCPGWQSQLADLEVHAAFTSLLLPSQAPGSPPGH